MGTTVQQPEVPNSMIPNLTVTEVFSPSSVDSKSIAAFLVGQGFMLAASAVLCKLFQVPPIIPSFDKASMYTALTVAIPIIGNFTNYILVALYILLIG